MFDIIRSTEEKLFGKYLLLTNTVSSGLLMYIGEIIAQTIDSKRNKVDKDEFKLDKVCQLISDLLSKTNYYINVVGEDKAAHSGGHKSRSIASLHISVDGATPARKLQVDCDKEDYVGSGENLRL